ncbi:MAG: flagellar protein FlaG [Lachnospiraceae bacterium]|nr:flagellar protein FlaG [Lachnospiraceae bacterium]
MSIEAIKSSGVAYQGSAATPEPAKVETTRAVEEPAQDMSNAYAGNGVQNLNTNGNEEEKTATNEQIKKAVENINKNSAQTEAVFGVHDGTNRVTIKIVDKESKKVIKEYPPEKTLDMIAKVWEMAGILVDEKR